MTSLECLKEAFAGESQANRRYLAFAKKADAEGFPQVARLFRAAAAAETVHAHAHLRAMNGVGSTMANLLVAIAGEAHEFQKMYPEFIQGAATPAALAAELRACIGDPARRERTAAQAARLRALLAQPAGGTAADWLARHL